VRAISRQLSADATAGVSRWKFKERHQLRARARIQAVEDAKIETERRAATQSREQHDLDAEWSKLKGLRQAGDSQARQWLVEETARRNAAREREQLEHDERWRRLLANDPETVGDALRDAFGEAPVSVVGMVVGTSVALVAVVVPRLEDAIADREAGYTPTGRPTLNGRTKTRMNELYLAVIASRTLFAANAALAAAPGLEGVRCVAVRIDNAGGPEPIYAGTLQKYLLEDLKGRAWIAEPDLLARIPAMADDAKVNRRGRAREVCALPPDIDGSVKTIMDLYAAGSTV
jgi:hypothetical protein